MAHDWQKDVYTLIYRFQGKRGLFLMIVVLLLIVSLLTGGLPAEAATLENPGEGQVYSGIGVISGWKCEADGPLTIRFNGGPPVPLVYGSERPDTRSVCGDANNGFVAIWNWGKLHADTQTARAPSGSSSSFSTVHADTHTARVYDNGVMFAATTFQVGTLGVEFLRGFEDDYELHAATGHNLKLAWNENTQHWEVGTGQVYAEDYSEPSEEEASERRAERVKREGEYDERRKQLEQRPPGWHTEAARLENPGDKQVYSGIGAISGWKCEADGLLTVRFNDGRSIPLVYGSERQDTRSVCGDANNGFVAIWNWGKLGEGIHTARVYDNGVAFAETTFQVGTMGVEFWDGTPCFTPDICRPRSFGSTLINETRSAAILHNAGPHAYVGYDRGLWAAPGIPSDPWKTYFKWNANTQHFEAFARLRYEPAVPPEPPEAWRWQEPSFEDRQDDFSGPQIHVYHAVPRNERGFIDMVGYISATVQAAQRWLAKRTYQGRAFRIDTYQGRPDLTTLPLAVTAHELLTYRDSAGNLLGAPILPGGGSLQELEQHNPDKLHVVFINALPSLPSSFCGVASPSSGVAVVLAPVETSLTVISHSLPLHCPRLSLVFVHEVFHLLGAVHPDAPHSDGTSHIKEAASYNTPPGSTDYYEYPEGIFYEDGRSAIDSGPLPLRYDVMETGGSTERADLDLHSDDYYFHPEKTYVRQPPEYDTVDSPFFTAGPWIDITRATSSHALRASPPEGPPAIAPDNQAEAGPYYRVLPEPLPEEPDGYSPNGWCVLEHSVNRLNRRRSSRQQIGVSRFGPEECAHYFTHAGYAST